MIESHAFFEAYDLLLLCTGLAFLITILATDLLRRFRLTTTVVYLAVGLLAGPLLLDLGPDDPLDAIPILERVSELAVIMSLIVIGIRIGRPFSWSGWQSTVRLILIVMPATILAIALTGHWLLGLALGPAILLGAILAPTDPILAGALEEQSLEDEQEDHFGLSSEAGFNDGFAFPFVYLGLYMLWERNTWQAWISAWVLKDVLYALAVALPLGWIPGYLCGRFYLRRVAQDAVSKKRREFLPLALLLATYGLAESLGTYGFLAAFVAGLGFRRALDEDRKELETFTNFTEAVDDLTKALVLIMLGALLRLETFTTVGWPLLAFTLIALLVVRPVITYLATSGRAFQRTDRIYWSWFGIRGIGSIYYLSYAIDSGVDEPIARTLFAITVATILLSVLLHGASLHPFMNWFEGGRDVEA